MTAAAKALLLGLAAALGSCATPPAQVASTATYTNPVLDADFPDPAVLKAKDGFYYVYATQGERDGRMNNIQVARSSDLVRWDHLGDALPAKPGWAAKTQDFWAPHVAEHGGRYYLYYSAKPDAALTDNSRGLCLAVATAARPEGPFTDIGKPLQCGEGFVNIDPMSYDDPKTGKRLLYWGSGFGPIKVQTLAPDRISFAPGSRPVDLVNVVKTDDPANYRRLVEGAWVHYRAPYYYLFLSGDNCCGPNAHYAALVARSKSATGPFEVREEPVVALKGIWVAPGHNAIATDAAGNDWIVYHAVDSRRPRSKPEADINSRRVMLIDPLVWDGGWPRTDGPSQGPRPAPAPKRAAAKH
jgi:arabinan endo-1,5-alpha-L-arabinosidase